MPSRLAIILLFLTCISSAHLSYGQQIIGDVPVSWIGNPAWGDLGPTWYPCDQKGQVLYRPDYRPEKDDHQSVARVNRDGSTSLFQISNEKEGIRVFAPSNNGVVVVAHSIVDAGTHTYHVYHFDDDGKVLSDHAVSFDFAPILLAVASSGEIIVVGIQRPYHSYRKPTDLKFGGAVLDMSDKVIHLFEFPPTAEGGNYAPIGPIVGGDGAAYLYLSEEESTKLGATYRYSIATIRKSGHVDIGRFLSQESKGPRFIGRLFGPGVDVEEYFVPLKIGNMMRFDEYDLATGKKLRAKITRFPNFTVVTTCDLEDEVVWMANQSDGKSHSTHRVTVKPEEVPLHN